MLLTFGGWYVDCLPVYMIIMEASMFSKGAIEWIHQAASIQRWNDHLRPAELTELDKQAHKMIIAYVIARYESESGSHVFDWIKLIEGGIIEFLHRVVVTDIKPPVFHKIMKEKGNELNRWVLQELQGDINTIAGGFSDKFEEYFFNENYSVVEKRILRAAHYLATNWEFRIIYPGNSFMQDIDKTQGEIEAQIEKHNDLVGVQKILLHRDISGFINLCGQLRLQQRWAQTPRIPHTSVLGHMLIVAILSYFCSMEAGFTRQRIYNNFFASLFHDLPEVLTRDIVSPLKRSVEGLDDIIKEYEKLQAEEKIYPLIPESWHSEIRYFTENEFTSKIMRDGIIEYDIPIEEMNTTYNHDKYNPLDGIMLKGCDDLAAFIEASLSIKYGIKPEALENGRRSIYDKYKSRKIGNLDFGMVFDYFN